MSSSPTSSPEEQRPQRVTGSPIFLVVVALYVTSLITANTLAVRILEVGPWVTDAGLLTFPIAYIVGGILTEVYGYGTARRIIWLGFLCNALAVSSYQIAGAIPTEASWDLDEAWSAIFGSTPRILIASFSAYLVGEFTNSFVLARLKILTAGRWLWMRTIGSTAIAQVLDTAIFVTLAFAGTLPNSVLISMFVTGWTLKTAYEVVATPLVYLVVNKLKQIEGIDTYDRNTDFNPFALGKESGQ